MDVLVKQGGELNRGPAAKADLEYLITHVDLNTALENLEERVIARMTIRLGLMLFAAAGLVVAAAKFL